jgi:hypothetical protein
MQRLISLINPSQINRYQIRNPPIMQRSSVKQHQSSGNQKLPKKNP